MKAARGPTLNDLRKRVFKHSGTDRPEIGNVMARRIGRPSAVYGTWVAVRLGLSANLVTGLAMAANLLGAMAIGVGTRWSFAAGVTCLAVGYWLDHVDGQVARWRQSATISGVYYDYLLHHATNLIVGFAMGFGLARLTGDLVWAVAGFAIASGWTLLNLHNDCRYKALFQKMKAIDHILRVDPQTKPRPAAAPSWPIQWPGVCTWPMAKMCEFHVVLTMLIVLAILGAGWERVWQIGWQGITILEAIIAPALALGRIARSISRGEADAEFDSWFRVEDGSFSTSARTESAARGVASCPRSGTQISTR